VEEEHKNLMEKHDNIVDRDDLAEMDVLHRCIKEAMKLHPSLLILLRNSHRDFRIRTPPKYPYSEEKLIDYII